MINELPVHTRFNSLVPIALWFNRKKPNMSIFLDLMANMIEKINEEPMECIINGEKRLIKLHILTCSVDSIARAAMQGVTQFNGKYGCNWCLHPTDYVINATKYPVKPSKGPIPPQKRTHEATVRIMRSLSRKQKKKLGIKALSPLIFLPNFNIIKGFVVDYMHCILLGVAKQITNYLIKPRDLLHYQKLLDSMKLPHQVCRLTRPIADNKYWKAREWENWVLYLSLPVFCTRLPAHLLKYWSLLVESLFTLLKTEISYDELANVSKMLEAFVKDTEHYFGKSSMSFNVHQLLHVTDTVKQWGPLWAHSAFAFEAGNHKLLQAIHCGKGVVLQILRFINISNAATILEKRLFTTESEIVQAYCINVLSTRVKQCIKVGNRTYFGKGSSVEKNITSMLQMSDNSQYYDRMILESCLYASCLKVNPRSDNSTALLEDGKYIRIEKFIVDTQQQKDIVKCKILGIATCSTYYKCTHLKRILEENSFRPWNPDVQYFP